MILKKKNLKIATILPYKESYSIESASAASLWVAEFYKNSKFKKELLKEFGEHFFNLISMELKSFDPQLIELMKEENELKNKYRSLLAGAEMKYKGKILNLAGLSPYMQDINRETRKEAYHLMDGFFNKNEKKLDDIFDKLVKVRDKKGAVLGFNNFIPLG